MRILAVSALGVVLIAGGGVGGYLVAREDNGPERSEIADAAAGLPAGWRLYVNRAQRFAIGYPGAGA